MVGQTLDSRSPQPSEPWRIAVAGAGAGGSGDAQRDLPRPNRTVRADVGSHILKQGWIRRRRSLIGNPNRECAVGFHEVRAERQS
jgi:hypothetical protein